MPIKTWSKILTSDRAEFKQLSKWTLYPDALEHHKFPNVCFYTFQPTGSNAQINFATLRKVSVCVHVCCFNCFTPQNYKFRLKTNVAVIYES